jgi:hypothetical protein
VTMGPDFVVDRGKVGVRMIITRTDVVHGVSTYATTDVTDPPVDAEDALALSVPRCGKPYGPVGASPLSGSHARPPDLRTKEPPP